MKKNYSKQVLIVLFVVIIVLCFVKYLKRGHIARYRINNKYDFDIVETRTRNEKNEIDNYYLDIKVNGINFTYQLFDDYGGKHKIVKNVYYFKDKEYTCIYPVLVDKSKVDIKCLSNDLYYYYSSIRGKDQKLDEFANNLKEYNVDDFVDNDKKVNRILSMKIYINNIISNHNIAITSLKGIYVLGNINEDIKIFEKDIYNRPLSIITDEYYVTADYNEKHQFRKIYLVNLTNNKKYTIESDEYISFNSYIQGVVDNDVYIYDIENEKQYKLSLDSRKINVINNRQNKVIYYQNNEWIDISITKANNITLFKMNIVNNDFGDYDYIYKYGNNLSGYYYLYKKINTNSYALYRTPVQDIKKIEYIVNVNDINNVFYIDDYVYFNIDNSIYYYSQTAGIRKIIDYDELKFNDFIMYRAIKVK